MNYVVFTMSLTMWGEARGLGAAGMTNVGQVIKNRAARPGAWGHDVVGVCLAHEQFSCWNGPPNRPKMFEVTEENDVAFALATTIADNILAGNLADDTEGATNYHTVAAPLDVEVWPPSWTKSMVATLNDGHHQFYRPAAPAV